MVLLANTTNTAEWLRHGITLGTKNVTWFALTKRCLALNWLKMLYISYISG